MRAIRILHRMCDNNGRLLSPKILKDSSRFWNTLITNEFKKEDMVHFFIIGQICRLVYIICNLKLISEKWTVLRVLDKESINTVESLQESYKLRPLSILQMAVIDDILATFSKY